MLQHHPHFFQCWVFIYISSDFIMINTISLWVELPNCLFHHEHLTLNHICWLLAILIDWNLLEDTCKKNCFIVGICCLLQWNISTYIMHCFTELLITLSIYATTMVVTRTFNQNMSFYENHWLELMGYNKKLQLWPQWLTIINNEVVPRYTQ